MRAMIFAIAATFLATPLCAASELEQAAGRVVGTPYNWASKRILGEYWGIAQADVNGDGEAETLLLARRSLDVGTFEGRKFKKGFSCGWKGDAEAARLDMMDVDGDGRKEALITAVEDGIPASLILKIDSGACKEIASHIPLSLRAAWLPPKDDGAWSHAVVGQGWSNQEYFSGPVEEYRFDSGKLKRVSKLNLPRYTKIYRFAYLPPEDERTRVVMYREAAPLEVRLNARGKKWQRLWRSPEKYGSSGNTMKAKQRPVLDQVQSYYVSFELAPIVMRGPSNDDILMVHYDMPLHNIVGRRPFIRGSAVIEYVPDDAFIYAEKARTKQMPGEVVDYFATDGDSGRELFVLVQDNRGAFENPTESMILRFELGGAPKASETREAKESDAAGRDDKDTR